jgi:hypothetical protein
MFTTTTNPPILTANATLLTTDTIGSTDRIT